MPNGLLETNASKAFMNGAQRDIKDFAVGGGLEAALEPSLLTQLLNLLAHRPRHSLLLSDLGALLPGNLRQGVKEKGGLRSWLQKYPEIFQVSGQPGKESVTLLVLAGGGSEAGNEPAPVGPQQGGQGLSVAELEAAKRREDEDNESAVQLRGLPYRATMQDVKNFLKHHAKNLKDDPNAVQLVLNRDGRPSGFGRVQFKTQEMARACRDEMHMRVMEVAGDKSDRDRGERYVEIFLYSERPNKLRFKKIVGDGPEHPDDAVEALGITKQHVLDECRAHMSMEGKSQLLLSMLGVALSPASRLYLKKTDQGLKHFLASCPNEFMVDGSKGRELITYLGNKKEEPQFLAEPVPKRAMETTVPRATTPQDGQSEKGFEKIETTLSRAMASQAPAKSSLPLPTCESPLPAPKTPVSPMPSKSNCATLGTRRGCDSAGPVSGNISDLGGFPATPLDDLMVPQSPVPMRVTENLEDFGACFQTPSDWGTPFENNRFRPSMGLGDANLNGSNFAGLNAAGPERPELAPPGLGPSSGPSLLSNWTAWGVPPAPSAFWPHLFDPRSGEGVMRSGAGSVPGLPAADPGLMMMGAFMSMPGPSPWPNAWGIEVGAAAQAAASSLPESTASEPDVIQKLLKQEIPIPGQLQSKNVPAARCMDAAQAPAAVRLRGLPYEATEQEILAWMAKYDMVDRILECRQAVRIYNKNNGKPMGVAVVAMNSMEDADHVVQVLNGQYMRTRYIEVFHHHEGEAGTDKAFVQGAQASTTGGTGSCNGSQAKIDVPSEANPFHGLGDTGGSGGAAAAQWNGEVGGPRPGAGAKGPGQETVTRWDEVMDFLSDVNFAPRSPGLRIDSM